MNSLQIALVLLLQLLRYFFCLFVRFGIPVYADSFSLFAFFFGPLGWSVGSGGGGGGLPSISVGGSVRAFRSALHRG